MALATSARTPIPDEPRTTLNLGTIHGGTSVNSIPESAVATIDFRSTSSEELLRLEVALHRAVEDAVEFANAQAKSSAGAGQAGFHDYRKSETDRPRCCRTTRRILEALQAVDRRLDLKTTVRLGSTDANIPLSLQVPAVVNGRGR